MWPLHFPFLVITSKVSSNENKILNNCLSWRALSIYAIKIVWISIKAFSSREKEVGNLGKSCSNFHSIICSAYIWTFSRLSFSAGWAPYSRWSPQEQHTTWPIHQKLVALEAKLISTRADISLIYDDQHALVRLTIGRLIEFLFLQSPYWMKHGWLRLDYVQLQQDINIRVVWYETFG